ncbi:nicotinate-nucleotide--dimethylbenzimidazole phosphoribosyltransferase [Fodinisporobacter ferrooxydans]|uniref:Nicotinate-nucleotide--dimethylbenzimidazole phosphoribosyltransferase n=1 Tax=Fodinisporobacter ferrooxydans TaxID=2901836 RepID=A0ABY4CKU9_9BACL|nr:nicotinate-nucleotide--dimethylbenzimidazole phosphoribosyltransferase [Alicyclobacillaceae bacterium MYW30-H2]
MDYQKEIEKRVASIGSLDRHSMKRTRERLNNLTMPLGSLGLIEELIGKISGITGTTIPVIEKPAAIIFAADHGVAETAEVSRYEAKVTEEMAVNICMGTAVSSVLARNEQADLCVVDVGVRTRVRHPNCRMRKVANGTRDFTKGPAMTKEQAYQAVYAGMETAEQAIEAGHDLLLLGEMGIGNTTASAAMVAVMLELPVADVAGHGTGISADQVAQKQRVVSEAICVNQPVLSDPWDVLAKLGGFEIAALAGAMVAAANRRIPIVLDGLITGAAALLAERLKPGIKDFLIASHQSAEPAHSYVLQSLDLQPLIQWNLRLGEGSGGLFLLPVIRNACNVLAETATFADARVTNPHLQNIQEDLLNKEDDPFGNATDARVSPIPKDFTEEERRAVYKAILARRDIRVFLPDPIPADVLSRILQAAHHAPSVGYMQPWSFIIIHDKQILQNIQEEVERERVSAAEHYADLQKDYYLRLKVEGLTQAPLSICVTNDPNRGGPHVLGRNTIPETDLMSTACAIENIWLAARAEGVALGWVSIYKKQNIREILHMPDSIDPVAILTLGYTPYFPEIPVLERVGWGQRLDLQTLIHYNTWGGGSFFSSGPVNGKDPVSRDK